MTLMQAAGWAAILAPSLGLAMIFIRLGRLIERLDTLGKRLDDDRGEFREHVRVDREAHANQAAAIESLQQRIAVMQGRAERQP